MFDIIIPVVLSALLGPGMGQLYNREFKKGTYLIVFSFVIFMAAGAWIYRASLPYFPADLTTITDRNAFQPIVQNALVHGAEDHPGTYFIYKILLLGTWMYGMMDAYHGGRRRRWLKRLPTPPSTPT